MSYIDPKEVAESYRPKSGTMSPGLRRARQQYRVKNAILGVALGVFAVGVWAYSISAVKQDVFDDIDAEFEVAQQASNKEKEKEKEREREDSALKAPSIAFEEVAVPSRVLTEVARSNARGIIPRYEDRLPHWLRLDPERKTLVWGAPPVDNIGKLQLGSRR